MAQWGEEAWCQTGRPVPSRPVPRRDRHLAGSGGPIPRGLRSPKGRPNPVPPMFTVPYKPSRGLNVKGVHKDVSRHCLLLPYVKIHHTWRHESIIGTENKILHILLLFLIFFWFLKFMKFNSMLKMKSQVSTKVNFIETPNDPNQYSKQNQAL